MPQARCGGRSALCQTETRMQSYDQSGLYPRRPSPARIGYLPSTSDMTSAENLTSLKS
jgi:hypothetical protein